MLNEENMPGLSDALERLDTDRRKISGGLQAIAAVWH